MRLADKAKQLLKVWSETETGQGVYKLTGPYWEVLYPLLKKYAPEELAEYEKLLPEPLDTFNEEVRQIYDKSNDEENYRSALNYFSEMEDNYATPLTVHHIDLGEGEIVPYCPNQSIDVDTYWGRERSDDDTE